MAQRKKIDARKTQERSKDFFNFKNMLAKLKKIKKAREKNKQSKEKQQSNLLYFAAGIGFTFILLLIFFVALLCIVSFEINKKEDLSSLFNQNFKENSFVVVPISGEIANCEGCANPQKISKALIDLKDNKKVKAVILDINSPGGSVAGVEEIMSAVKKLKQSKPVVSVISQEGASGAYFIAGESDRIFVQPHAIVGALGVIMSYKYYKGLYEKLGINVSVFKSGDMKDMGADYRPPTPKEQQRFQTIVNTLYNDLLNEFLANRNISSKNLEQIKTGTIFLGKEAISINLADEIGGKDQAVDYLSNKLNITNPNVQDYDFNKKKGFFDIENLGRAMGEGIAKQILTQQKQIDLKA